jgi:hypothetical protein
MEDHFFDWITRCTNLIRDVGFPIFVALWFMLVLKKSLDQLTAAIKCLTRAFERANIPINSKKEGGE